MSDADFDDDDDEWDTSYDFEQYEPLEHADYISLSEHADYLGEVPWIDRIEER